MKYGKMIWISQNLNRKKRKVKIKRNETLESGFDYFGEKNEAYCRLLLLFIPLIDLKK